MPRAMKYKKPSLEEIKAEAAKYTKRSELKEANHRIYYVAMKDKLLDELYPTENGYHRKWTAETLAEEAQKYSTKTELYRANASAYQTARRLGVLDEICAHMKPAQKSDYDVVYIAKVPGTDIYKVGLTSKRLGLQRLEQIKPKVELVTMVCFNKHIYEIEQALLRIGQKIEGEFRRWSPKDLEQAMCVLGKYLAIL